MTLVAIESISQLKKNLNLGSGYEGYGTLLNSIHIPISEWEPLCAWKDSRYTRNCISSCDFYELILMCWKGQQHSPIHSYKFQESWIKVLQGKLCVELFDVDKKTEESVLKEVIIVQENECIALNDDMGFHRVKNYTSEETISLHLNMEKSFGRQQEALLTFRLRPKVWWRFQTSLRCCCHN